MNSAANARAEPFAVSVTVNCPQKSTGDRMPTIAAKLPVLLKTRVWCLLTLQAIGGQ